MDVTVEGGCGPHFNRGIHMKMKKEQVVIVGFGVTLVGVAGALGIYLPRHSSMAQKGRERTSRAREAMEKDDVAFDSEKKSSSPMWKNVDKKHRGE
ncbi:hypothetical protein CCR75_004883 [Bremia lactucae]|uniref:Uncharacterized protein n=1 Tax=Bremia lactucae TaxID=4779 RepID=A0A976IHS8_BRELC|nr:hypothetical protein CCR75_004883 [Bremia lactucae]